MRRSSSSAKDVLFIVSAFNYSVIIAILFPNTELTNERTACCCWVAHAKPWPNPDSVAQHVCTYLQMTPSFCSIFQEDIAPLKRGSQICCRFCYFVHNNLLSLFLFDRMFYKPWVRCSGARLHLTRTQNFSPNQFLYACDFLMHFLASVPISLLLTYHLSQYWMWRKADQQSGCPPPVVLSIECDESIRNRTVRTSSDCKLLQEHLLRLATETVIIFQLLFYDTPDESSINGHKS
jgi:hypothetical protein